jgi:hypothetical protein
VILQASPRAAAQLSIFTQFIRNANEVVQRAGIQIHEEMNRATCTIEAASSCILQMQTRPCGVEAFGPARTCLFLSQALVGGRWLPTGRLQASKRRIHQTRRLALDSAVTLAHRTLKLLPRRELEPQAEYAGKERADHMSLVTIVITLIVVGVLLWLVNTYIPMDGKIKKILNIVVVVVVVLWLLNVFGVMGNLRNVRASIQSPFFGTSICSVVSPSGLVVDPAIVTTS